MLGRTFTSLVGTALIALGAVTVLGTGALYEYAHVAQAYIAAQAEAETTASDAPLVLPTSVPKAATSVPAVLTSVPAAVPSGTPTPLPSPSVVAALNSGDAGHPIRPTANAVAPTATAPAISTAIRLVVPSIGLDAGVAEAPLSNGAWTIPKFEAGHLQGTAQPLSGGNVVLAGHVQSITSGDVFGQLSNVKVGDSVTLYTKTKAVTYVVRSVKDVSNDDLSVLKPTKQETLTLITCSGSWLPLQHDYSDRTVVVAVRSTH